MVSACKEEVVKAAKAVYQFLAGAYTSTYHNGKSVLNGDMSVGAFATEVGKVYLNGFIAAYTAILLAVVNAYGGLLATPGYIADGDWEGAAKSWTKGAINAVSVAVGARITAPVAKACKHSFLPATLVLMADGTTQTDRRDRRR